MSGMCSISDLFASKTPGSIWWPTDVRLCQPPGYHQIPYGKQDCRSTSIAKICHPDITRDEIMQFTLHSIRVWVVVLLDESVMNTDFIKSWLRWMGDLYRSYLRDTAVLQTKHISAFESSSNNFIKLFGKNRTTLPDIFPVDDTMGPYWCTKGTNISLPILSNEGGDPNFKEGGESWSFETITLIYFLHACNT